MYVPRSDDWKDRCEETVYNDEPGSAGHGTDDTANQHLASGVIVQIHPALYHTAQLIHRVNRRHRIYGHSTDLLKSFLKSVLAPSAIVLYTHTHARTHARTHTHTFYGPLSRTTGRMPFLPPNQQSQSTIYNMVLTTTSKPTFLPWSLFDYRSYY